MATQAVPVHSDCIVPDSHRILYSPPFGGTSAIQFYIFSDIADYSISRRIVNEKSAATHAACGKKPPAPCGSARGAGENASLVLLPLFTQPTVCQTDNDNEHRQQAELFDTHNVGVGTIDHDTGHAERFGGKDNDLTAAGKAVLTQTADDQS